MAEWPEGEQSQGYDMTVQERVMWVCSYTKDGKTFDVNLPGTSSDAVLLTYLQQYPGLEVHGRHVQSYDGPECLL